MNCLFCKIINREIGGCIVYETDNILAFRDIDPQAPVHVLIIPKEHITSLNDLSSEKTAVIGDMVLAAKQIAKNENLQESGYRLIANCGKDAGQAVEHIHFHLLGGRKMTWPPG